MTTAIDIIQDITIATSKKLNTEIKFYFGSTISVVNYIQELKKIANATYPAVILFTDGISEEQYTYGVRFNIPKVAICCNTVLNLTELQKRELIFDKIIYPICEQFQKECKFQDFNVVINRTDIPYVNENKSNTFNELVDGCIIKNLKMDVVIQKECS